MSLWTEEYAKRRLAQLAPIMFEKSHGPQAVILAAVNEKGTQAEWKSPAEIVLLCHQVGWTELAAEFVVEASSDWTRALLVFPDDTFHFFKIRKRVLS
jgi:hypothetical protein